MGVSYAQKNTVIQIMMSILLYTFLFPFYPYNRILKLEASTLKRFHQRLYRLPEVCENVCLLKPLTALDIIF